MPAANEALTPPPTAPYQSSRRSRARSSSSGESADVPRLVVHDRSSPPTTQPRYTTHHSSYYGQQQQQHPHVYNLHDVASQQKSSSSSGHQRTRSWSNSPGNLVLSSSVPSEAFVYANESQPLMSERQQTGRPPQKEHRRTLSGSHAYPMHYGTAFHHQELPPQQPVSPIVTNSRKRSPVAPFSPRNELRSLVRAPRLSDSPMSIPMNSMPPQTFFPAGYQGSPTAVQSRKSWSPTIGSVSPLQGEPNVLNETSFLLSQPDPLAPEPPQSSRRLRHRNSKMRHQESSNISGNAPTPRSESRKVAAAQSAIQSVKGQPQSRACRDVAFLLLFAFHLAGIGMIGKLYGVSPIDATLIQEVMHGKVVTGSSSKAKVFSNATMVPVLAISEEYHEEQQHGFEKASEESNHLTEDEKQISGHHHDSKEKEKKTSEEMSSISSDSVVNITIDSDDSDTLPSSDNNMIAEDTVTSTNATVAAFDDYKSGIHYNNLIYLACLCGPFAVALSALLLSAMTLFTRHFVQIALFLVIALSFIWGTVGIGLSPQAAVPATGIIFLTLTVAYTFIVWDRIPFAAANLVTALNGIHANPGTIVLAFCFQALTLGWTIYFASVVIGVNDALEDGRLKVPSQWQPPIWVALSISYYWTFQVMHVCTGIFCLFCFLMFSHFCSFSQNAVQVATASIIGGWWIDPSNKKIFRHSCFDTFFYYMGSVCLGSIVVGPIHTLRQLAGFFRPTASESASLMSLHECMHLLQTNVSSCIDSVAKSFNMWGFTYVGLYGYSFTEASNRADDLFEARGWTMIVSDDLVPNVLLITSLVVGGVTGCFAYLISHFHELPGTVDEDPGLIAFAEGAIIGCSLTVVLLGVIGSAVSTVIVCFGASPIEFEQNHVELSQEMRLAWRTVWPGALDVVDVRMSVPSPIIQPILNVAPPLV